MIHKIPENKICSICKVDLPASAFSQDASRVDGLKFCCRECSKTYKPSKSKRNFDYITKLCEFCNRILPAKSFAYSQHSEDRLSSECRTCKMLKRGISATTVEIESFEETMEDIYRDSLYEIADSYNVDDDVAIERYRSEFERKVYLKMESEGLLVKWKPPVWVHSSSLPPKENKK